MNTVINNGNYVKPQIIDAYVDKDNKELQTIGVEESKVISPYTVNTIKDIMKEVVERGTGRLAKVKGLEMGGKTGSTERIEVIKSKDNNEEKKEYSDGWFIGYFKAKDKYYSAIVFVKNIDKNTEGGGNTAAPIFKDVVEKVIKYKGE
ncbi:peptidoglycanglycosyltransferase [Clostridium tetanomorphum]|nr:peptidoglycanglycosyltransferase [Clostridium tetanomorphum]